LNIRLNREDTLWSAGSGIELTFSQTLLTLPTIFTPNTLASQHRGLTGYEYDKRSLTLEYKQETALLKRALHQGEALDLQKNSVSQELDFLFRGGVM
jgi:hypothetical protein